jgi:diguanylate cyclase (GGDEF)-like protein/PAS domain S-box-containing protein
MKTASGESDLISASVFEELAEQALVGMTVVADGRIVYANAKCCRLFGYARSEFLRLSPFDLVIDGQREAVRERMERRLRREICASEYFVCGVRKDGSSIELEVRGTTIEMGGKTALATSFVDVTETRRAKQELERQLAVTQDARRKQDVAQRYLDVAGVMIMVFAADETISLVNRMGCDVLGYSGPEELIGRNWIDIFIPEPRRSEIRAAFHSFLDGTSPSVENYENSVLTRAGDERIISWRNQRLIDAEGNTTGILSSGEDITERRRAEASLRASETRFRQIAENLHEVFWITNADKTAVEYVSPAYEQVWGRSVPDVYARPTSFLDAIVPEDRNRIERQVRGQASTDFDVEYRIARPGGEIRWIHDRSVRIKNDEGRVYRLIGIAEDITQRKHAEIRLHELAHFDQLTGLANRASFLQRLDAELAQAGAGTVVLLDLDGFKKVNDSAGHHVGDLLLQAAAGRLAAAVPPGALISRWGGDEFALFLSSGPAGLEHIAGSIQGAFAEPFLLPRRKVFLSASLGMASSPNDGGSAEELLMNADLALYDAKAAGKATSRVFTVSMKDAVQKELELETELRRAFSNSEFELFYQPQVDLKTGTLVGAEALLRWRHPERGLLEPAAFLRVLKESPIAAAVGNWTIARAVAAAAELHLSGNHLRIAVNLFSAQVRAGGLEEIVARSLEQHPIPPELVEIEITEKIVLGADAKTISTLAAIRDLGVGIAFDDYGTGYASLSMLTQYPLTRLKIDRSFVSRMENNPGDAAIIKAMIGLGQGFELHLTAEGIETIGQAEALCGLGCQEGQGYLFGRPMPYNEFRRLAADKAKHSVFRVARRSA